MSKPVKMAGKLWVSRHYPDGTEEQEERNLEVQTFEVPPAVAKASVGLTINMGNYESARCDAGIELPAYVEELPAAFKRAWEIVQEEVRKQTVDIKKR